MRNCVFHILSTTWRQDEWSKEKSWLLKRSHYNVISETGHAGEGEK
jgi:hypothetical protein